MQRLAAADSFLGGLGGSATAGVEDLQVRALTTAMSLVRWEHDTANEVISVIQSLNHFSKANKDRLLGVLYDGTTQFRSSRQWSMQNFTAFPRYLSDAHWNVLRQGSPEDHAIMYCGNVLRDMGCMIASEPTYATAAAVALAVKHGSVKIAATLSDTEKHGVFKQTVLLLKPFLKRANEPHAGDLPPNPAELRATRPLDYEMYTRGCEHSTNPPFELYGLERLAFSIPMRWRSTPTRTTNPGEHGLLSSLTSLVQVLAQQGREPNSGSGIASARAEIPITYLSPGGSRADISRLSSVDSIGSATDARVPLALTRSLAQERDEEAPLVPNRFAFAAPLPDSDDRAGDVMAADSPTGVECTVLARSATDHLRAALVDRSKTKDAPSKNVKKRPAAAADVKKRPAAASETMAKPLALKAMLKRPAASSHGVGRLDHEQSRKQFLVRVPSGSKSFKYQPASPDSVAVAKRKAEKYLSDNCGRSFGQKSAQRCGRASQDVYIYNLRMCIQPRAYVHVCTHCLYTLVAVDADVSYMCADIECACRIEWCANTWALYSLSWDVGILHTSAFLHIRRS